MPRLIHLNGPPGVGKSTPARLYADGHPGVLDLDIDLVRALIGGWPRSSAQAHDRTDRRGALLTGQVLATGRARLP